MHRDFYPETGPEWGRAPQIPVGPGETPLRPDPSMPLIGSEDAAADPDAYNPDYRDFDDTGTIGVDDTLAPESDADPGTAVARPLAAALGGISLPEPEHTPAHNETDVSTNGDGQIETPAPSPAIIGEADIVTDPELAGLLHSGLETLGEAELDKVLRANEPFNHPVTVVHEDGSETYEPHFSNKNLLRELPALTESAAAAGVTPEQATDVLTHAMGSVNYPDIDHGLLPKQLARTFQAAADTGEPFVPDQLAGIKDMVTKAGHDDVIEMSLSSYEAARRAGISHEDSLRLVNDHIDTANYRQLGYKMYHFRDALRALDSGGIDPAVTVDVFDQIRDMHPEYRGDTYDDVSAAIVFGSAANEKSPNDMMRDVAERLRAGGDQQAAGEITSGQSDTGEGIIIAPREQRDTYFPEVPGNLQNRALPYRTERSFGDGMRDIERLTHNRSTNGEVVSEGHWVYDPESSNWYSHGGESYSVGPGRYRHTSIGYDVSELSSTPRSIHIHPEEYAMRSDKYGFVFPTNADYRAAAYMIENAHDPVQMRSFISHPLGVTEFTYPSGDPQAIRAVAETFEQLRNSFFDNFQGEDHVLAVAGAVGPEAFAQMSVAEVRAMLPPGFTLHYYPPGTNIDQIEG
jgi:hypothetical protein